MIWGIPRRFYRDGLNVRVEHWRTAEPPERSTDVCELPDQYAVALRYYAQAKALSLPGAGQDPQLSQWYQARYQRVMARMQRRLTQQRSAQAVQMGGSVSRLDHRPPRPSLPWNYGSRTR